MGANQLPRSQSLTRQKPNGGTMQRWDSGLGNNNGTISTCNSSNARNAGVGAAVAPHIGRQFPEKIAKSSNAAPGSNCGGDANATRPKIFYSGELTRARSPSIVSVVSSTNSNSTDIKRDAATNTDSSTTTNATSEEDSAREGLRNGRFRASVRVKKGDNHAMETKELLPKLEPARRSDDLMVDACNRDELRVGRVSSDLLLQRDAMCNSNIITNNSMESPVVTPTSTSAQTEKEGSSSRLLSRGGESSSFRGKQISASSRRESLSFRRETVSSSFRKEVSSSFRKESGGSRRKERKATKSFQDGEVSSIASESARGSPCSIHYNHPPFSGKNAPAPSGVPWASSPSSPDTACGKSSVPFQWEEAPGKAKTIAAAAEMALARKLVRDESLRKLNGASPRSSVDSHGSFRSEKKVAPPGSRSGLGEQCHQQPQSHQLVEQQHSSVVSAGAAEKLPLPPSKRVSQEMPVPRMDSTSSQLIEDLKAAVVRKQVGLVVDDSPLAIKKFVGVKSDADEDVDVKSIISDYCCVGEAQIDLVAPAAAKFLNRVEDIPNLTPVKTPLAAVPFKWEDAPGKPKESVASPSHHLDAPSLSLPPRLLGGCHNPSKEQAAKILQTYSCNLMDMHWSSSGNPTPHSRSRDATPTRRERTPTRRDRTPTKRDITPGRREITPTRRDSTPTRSYFPTRVVPKSGPITLPSAAALECVRDHHSGPLRSYTNPNYLNVPPRSVSQEFARVTQDSALTVLAQDLDRSNRTTSETGSGTQLSCRSSSITSQELQIVRRDSSPDVSVRRGGASASECSRGSSQKCKAIVKITAPVDPLSPTSILCGPEVDSSQRTVSNLSSAYAESSHSHRQETISEHTKSDSCTSLESFVDESYNMPPPWDNGDILDSSYHRELGPTDVLSSDASQINNTSIEDGVKAIVKFCKKAKKWNKSKAVLRKNSAEPDMWAPTLATYFQKIELGGAILGKVGSQVCPESKDKDAKVLNVTGVTTSVPCSPLRFIPRSGELASSTPDRLGARKPLGSMTPVHVITTCRSPSYRVMATDECLSVFCIGKVWNATKARHAKWGRKMRRSSRFMVAIFATLKRSMLLKCGRQSLPDITSDKNLLDRDGDVASKENSVKVATPHADAVHSLSADHQFHRPL